MTSLTLRGRKPKSADIVQVLADLQVVEVDRTAMAVSYGSPSRGL